MPHHESPPPPKHLSSPPPLTPLRAIPYTLSPYPPLATGSTSRILLAHTITTASPIALKLPLPSTPASTATHEARILTHLTHHSTSTHFPRFHGLDPQTHAILLELLPRGTLRAHSLALRRNNPGFLREPVGGARAWLLLARGLCKAFLELKALGVVHGDVSWSNILLRNDKSEDGGEGAAQICVVDFAQASMRGAEGRQGVVSAGFCAPEVLEGLVKGWEGGWGCEQDGYSVCMVLLASALGEEVYGGGRYESLWARQGRPLEWIAGGDGGSVVRGLVGRVLRGCFGLRVGERVGLEEVGLRVEQELAKLDEARG